MKTRVHINIAVSDIEASVGFYSTLFGTQPTKLRDDYANFRLNEPALHLALVKAPAYAQGDSLARHFGIELFENTDLNDWRNRLQKADVELKVEEQVTCCYAVGNKFWARDPDGNDWEFWIRTQEADAMYETGARSASDGLAGDACCTPAHAKAAIETAASKDESACCTPATAGKPGCC